MFNDVEYDVVDDIVNKYIMRNYIDLEIFFVIS